MNQETRLDSLFSILDQRELKSFSGFLDWQVSVNVRHKKQLPLMKKIVSSFIHQRADEKSGLFSSVSDKEKRYIMGDLSVYLQTFLVYRNAFNNNALYRNLLFKELAKRNALKPLNTLYKEQHTKREEIIREPAGHHYLYEAEKIFSEISLLHSGRKQTPAFNSISRYLDAHYILQKLKLFCEMANYSNVMAADMESLFFHEIIKEVKGGKFSDSKHITIYYYVLMTLINHEDERFFKKLKELVYNSENYFDALELMDFYHYLKNYCVKKINSGDLSYRPVLLDIYKTMMSAQNLFRKQWLSQWDYKNAVTIALREQEYNWAKSFIEKNNSFLIAVERKNAYRYNMAALNFAQKNFREARKLLQFVKTDDVFYRLDARLMMMKIYFELEDIDGLYYHISAFKKFLFRNKQISDYQKNIYTNLIKMVSRLTNALNNKSQLKKLNADLKTAKNVADIQWLKEKVEELI